MAKGPVRLAVRRFFEQDGLFLAAGLSFYVLICILPLILLLVAAGGYLLADQTVLHQLLDRLVAGLPPYRSEIETVVTDVVEARGVSSLVGAGVLALFASQLFTATRFVLNRVLGGRGRSFIHGAFFDVWMLLVLGLLFLFNIGVTTAFVWVRGIALLFERGTVVASAFHWAGMLLAVGLDAALFLVLYRFVPNVRVPWSSVLAGSVTAAVLWGLAKQAFRWYIEEVGVYSAVYGSLGVAIALMTWVYYSAVVFVLGASLVRALEDRRNGTTVA